MDEIKPEVMWATIEMSIKNGLGLPSSVAKWLYDAYHEALVPRIPSDTTKFEVGDYDPVEIKTIGQLIDELIIENQKVWHLIDEVKEDGDTYLQYQIQKHNDIRRSLVRALDKRLGERDIGGRV